MYLPKALIHLNTNSVLLLQLCDEDFSEGLNKKSISLENKVLK